MDPKKQTLVSESLLKSYKATEYEIREAEDKACGMFKAWKAGGATPEEVAEAFNNVAGQKDYLRHLAMCIARDVMESVERGA